jgi:tetratricopeptide (TPR) repeat protein
MRGDSLYVLDVSVHDVRGPSPARLYTVTSASLIALADQAAAHLAGLAGATSGAPSFAELETSSLEAYQHYVRARQAADEGRYDDAKRALDAAIALDSSFVSALSERVTAAWTDGEQQVVVRLNAALGRALAHASPFDRLRDAAERAMHNGEHARSEALGRALVAAYPRDPRAYALLANLYTMHGRWDAADSVLTQELGLDSLATAAGTGPCAPCVAYSGLATLRALRGDMRGAARAAQRWVDLQPDVPGAWSSLAALLSFDGRFDAAIDAHRRAVALAPDAGYGVGLARVLIMARRLDQADAVIAEMLRSDSRAVRVDALDVRALLERERGQFRQAHHTIDEALATDSGAGVLRLMDANGLSRVGDYALARATFRAQMQPTGAPVAHPAGLADDARAFAWGRALLGDAIATVADTMELAALADSIEIEGGRSYYGRDWRLPHHIRGLIAMRAGDYPRAIRELSAARWGTAGWTVTVVALARAQLALGRATDAVRTLRDAYTGPLDAMGRYQPRSEIDYWMSTAFARAGMRDSAQVYAGYVRMAWRSADPEVFRLLATLPTDSSSAIARVVAER